MEWLRPAWHKLRRGPWAWCAVFVWLWRTRVPVIVQLTPALINLYHWRRRRVVVGAQRPQRRNLLGQQLPRAEHEAPSLIWAGPGGVLEHLLSRLGRPLPRADGEMSRLHFAGDDSRHQHIVDPEVFFALRRLVQFVRHVLAVEHQPPWTVGRVLSALVLSRWHAPLRPPRALHSSPLIKWIKWLNLLDFLIFENFKIF